jgi:anti-sigma factor RsiW
VLAVAAAAVLVDRSMAQDRGTLAALTGEAVSDHLRVLQRDRPVDVESTGTHQVKPWFEGKLDFAPSVPAPVEPDMRLEGASVGYFLDRKAAVVVYGLRRHVLTLLVFRADGLRWPGALAQGERIPSRAALRGFHVFLWRSGGLAYALVGDADRAELAGIAAKLAAST